MSSEITAENAHLYAANTANYNITPQSKTRSPWWKRWFSSKPSESWGAWEYVTTCSAKRWMIQDGQRYEWQITAVIYRRTHLLTNARCYQIRTDGDTYDIDPNAYEMANKIVKI